MKMIWRYEDGIKIWGWYEDMKLQHLSLLRSGENLHSAVSLLQSFSICVCRVTEEGRILQHSGSLGLYLYTAAGDIQYCDTIPFFHVPNTLISLIICHHDNKIRDNVSNFLWGLLKPEHMEIISRFSTIADWIERSAMVFTFADIWFAIFE